MGFADFKSVGGHEYVSGGFDSHALPPVSLLATACSAFGTLTHRGASVFIVTAFPPAYFLVTPILKARRQAVLRSFTIGAGVFAVAFLTIGGLVLVNRFSSVGLYDRVLLASGQL